ncbi:alginate lyase family protein [Rhizophagus clarus]|uniref:Alginate lyase family protein n=1 Tax=Rhizophagus clarus TaxID=94130 RepID=A0A8H3KTC4_9GLOM|nr:alginate lyase family protein [Rhizophagus clarus]
MKSELGKNESNAKNNYATFYIAQLAIYLNFTKRTKDANDLIEKFANTTFKDMILESGKQPKESNRRKPYYYHTEDKTVLLLALYKVRDYYGDKFGVYADTMIKLLKEIAGDSK